MRAFYVIDLIALRWWSKSTGDGARFGDPLHCAIWCAQRGLQHSNRYPLTGRSNGQRIWFLPDDYISLADYIDVNGITDWLLDNVNEDIEQGFMRAKDAGMIVYGRKLGIRKLTEHERVLVLQRAKITVT